MRKQIGKKVAEVVCPLCNSVYLLSVDEVIVEKRRQKVNFYCDDCDRQVRIDIKDRSLIRERFVPSWYDWNDIDDRWD